MLIVFNHEISVLKYILVFLMKACGVHVECNIAFVFGHGREKLFIILVSHVR